MSKKIFWVFALPNVVNFMAKTLENNMEKSPKIHFFLASLAYFAALALKMKEASH